MEIFVEIAGITFKICSNNIGIIQSIEELYSNFLSPEEKYDFTIKIELDDMEGYINRSKFKNHSKDTIFINLMYSCQLDIQNNSLKIITTPNNSVFSFEQIFQILLSYLLPQKNMLLVHSSSIYDDNDNAYFFIGPSCIGKSTICQNSKLKIISDDLTIIQHLEANLFNLYTTPFTRNKSNNQKIGPLKIKGFYRLVQSDNENIIKVTKAEAFSILLSNNWGIYKDINISDTLKMIEVIIREIPVYLMKFTRNTIPETLINM